jgi:hypothetical protein
MSSVLQKEKAASGGFPDLDGAQAQRQNKMIYPSLKKDYRSTFLNKMPEPKTLFEITSAIYFQGPSDLTKIAMGIKNQSINLTSGFTGINFKAK